MNQLIEQVANFYEQINTQTTAFQTATGLECPSGCGKCCQNPEVESTPLEMLPLAAELLRRGEANAWLEKVAEVDEMGVCVFYHPDPLVSGNGRCQVYAWRPLLCRLFGFAAIRNKQGQPELAACVEHKNFTPEVVQKAQVEITAGLTVPDFSDSFMQLANLDPTQGQTRIPINQALKIAIQRLGLLTQMSNS